MRARETTEVHELLETEKTKCEKARHFLLELRDTYPDMTISQAVSLVVVAERQPNTPMSVIQHTLQSSPSAATRCVTSLGTAKRTGSGVGPGLVEQHLNLEDRRSRFVLLTEKGLATLKRALSRI